VAVKVTIAENAGWARHKPELAKASAFNEEKRFEGMSLGLGAELNQRRLFESPFRGMTSEHPG
jgi:hypothetical protein